MNSFSPFKNTNHLGNNLPEIYDKKFLFFLESFFISEINKNPEVKNILEEIKKYYVINRDPFLSENKSSIPKIRAAIFYEIKDDDLKTELIKNFLVPYVVLEYFSSLEKINSFDTLLESELIEEFEISVTVSLMQLILAVVSFNILLFGGKKLNRFFVKILSKFYDVVKKLEKNLKIYKNMTEFLNNIPKECLKEFIKEYDLVKQIEKETGQNITEKIRSKILSKFYKNVPFLSGFFNKKELRISRTIHCTFEALSSAAALQLKYYFDCLIQSKSLKEIQKAASSPVELFTIPDSPLITTLSKISPEVCKQHLDAFKDTVKLYTDVVKYIHDNDLSKQKEYEELLAKKLEKILDEIIKEFSKNKKSSIDKKSDKKDRR